MNSKGKNNGLKKILLLAATAVIIKVFSLFPSLVEQFYSSGIYPFIAISLRWLTGWLPFSFGDLLYSVAIVWLIVRLYKTIKAFVKRKVSKQIFLHSLRRTAIIVLWVYVIFNLFWGLNYDRLGIAYQLKIEPDTYSTNDLKTLTGSLIEHANTCRKVLGDSSFVYPDCKQIFNEASEAYTSAETNYPFLHYASGSVKKSLYSELGNYVGYLGYYNPFTGEAQVNATVPGFIIPYTTCHEIGHQLGYATEDEANFAGYLAAKSSKENTFKYSVYFDLFLYANRELFYRDSAAAKQNYKLLDTLVRKDISTYRKFIEAHKNPVEPYITMLYGKYLQANNQPNGMETYDEVIGWLIAYQKKYGEL